VSDQDFFFDEEPTKPAPDAPASKSGGAKSGAAKPAAKPASSSKTEPAAAVPFLEQSTVMSVAILIGVVGLLVGLIGGYLLGTAQTQPAAAPASGAVGTVPDATGQGGAPVLTQEQINAGQVPAGHPSIATSGAATTPSGTVPPTSTP
jgi:hypothetical protein